MKIPAALFPLARHPEHRAAEADVWISVSRLPGFCIRKHRCRGLRRGHTDSAISGYIITAAIHVISVPPGAADPSPCRARYRDRADVIGVGHDGEHRNETATPAGAGLHHSSPGAAVAGAARGVLRRQSPSWAMTSPRDWQRDGSRAGWPGGHRQVGAHLDHRPPGQHLRPGGRDRRALAAGKPPEDGQVLQNQAIGQQGGGRQARTLAVAGWAGSQGPRARRDIPRPPGNGRRPAPRPGRPALRPH